VALNAVRSVRLARRSSNRTLPIHLRGLSLKTEPEIELKHRVILFVGGQDAVRAQALSYFDHLAFQSRGQATTAILTINTSEAGFQDINAGAKLIGED